MARWIPMVLAATSIAVALAGCEEGAQHAQHEIIHTHVPEVQRIVHEDIQRGVSGVEQAATKIARGFLVEDRDQRQREIRTVLHLLRQPPRGIQELMISPISFVAAVGSDGIVICRDADPDPMAGFDAGQAFDVVHRAIADRESGYALDEFPNIDPEQPSSQTVLYAAPAIRDDQVVGVVMSGTPLWRTSQRLSRQLQADHATEIARGLILWVYLYRGAELHHHGTPNDLDTVVPDEATRSAGLARSPGGFTGEVLQYGRWYAYGVVPLPEVGPDVGAVVFRSDIP